uniref:Minor capsid protein P11 C-terminal conserved region domain-containing protein n=1 Tax=viral metagenome TaxID=1070528 RepID=A0A6C0LEB1_9ZZZZ
MSSFSGLSAILTVSLVALLTVQMLKDKFEMVENYDEHDDNGHNMNNMDYMQPHTIRDVSTAQNVREVTEELPVHARNLNDVAKHGQTPFVTGDFFSPPFVSENANANGWNGFPEAFAMYQQQVNSSTPNAKQLDLIGSSTQSLPGPNTWTQDSFAQANVNTGRAANLSLCSQNMNTFGVGNSAIASSLLPQNSKLFNGQLEGFSDCDVTNTLASQVFLTPGGQAGANSISGSLKNGNQGLRSEPPNPVLAVGPWNLSSIYPDLTRRPLEGCGSSFGLYGNGPNGGGTPTTIAP